MSDIWLHVIGLGDDGPDGLSAAARDLIANAEVLVGGARHLAMIGDGPAERLSWADGYRETLDALLARRDRRVVVLATGDPQWFGIGAILARHVAPSEMRILPAPGSVSLAAARLAWPLQEVAAVSLHGRPLESVRRHLAPGARLLVLSENARTPARLAGLLAGDGWGASSLVVFEHLGGARERRIDGTADAWREPAGADLNIVAVTCRADRGTVPLSLAPGLPDDVFDHDGQITKREVRAATIAALAPKPGETLWDVGAGSGSVAIEWLRAAPGARAVAVERDPARTARIRHNAAALGVPELEVVTGHAPAVLDTLGGPPDAVFVGGGVSADGLLEACLAALEPGGRLVANAVTLDAERRLLDFRARHGGDLLRLSVARAAPVGERAGFAPLRTVTQLRLTLADHS